MTLNQDQLNHLCQQRDEGDTATRQLAINAIVTANVGLAIKEAKPYLRHANDYEDYLQAAYEALVRAAVSYDASRGYAFSTYATRAIRNEIARSRSQRSAIKGPAVVDGGSFAQAVREGADATELGAQRGLSAAQIDGLLMAARSALSLDAHAGDDEGDMTFADLCEAAWHYDDEPQVHEDAEALADALSAIQALLTEREYEAFCLRMNGASFADIAFALNVRKQTAHETYERAKSKIPAQMIIHILQGDA